MRRALGFLLIFGCAVSLMGSLVSADTVRGPDGDDIKGPLDIAWIKHSHRSTKDGGQRLVHTIRLYERWPVKRLRHQGFINVFFDLRGNRYWRPERAVYISFEDGKLRAELVNFAADPPQFVRRLRLRRPDGRTVKFALRKSDLRRRSFPNYRWQAVSFIEEDHPLCGRPGGCDDQAPNSGYLCHDL
jgi:hypothetical protein